MATVSGVRRKWQNSLAWKSTTCLTKPTMNKKAAQEAAFLYLLARWLL